MGDSENNKRHKSGDKRYYIQKTKDYVNKFKGITRDELIIKITVNDPYLSDDKAKKLIDALIIDRQLLIDKEGIITCPTG